jgi:RHS repeat-associated protein
LLGRVERTRRWANVSITYDYMVDSVTSEVLYVSLPEGKVAAGAWDGNGTAPTNLAWSSNGHTPKDYGADMLSYSRTVYDPAGRVKYSISLDETRSEQVTSYEYDAAGRQTIITDPLGHVIVDRDLKEVDSIQWHLINTSSDIPYTSPPSHYTETFYDGTRREAIEDAAGNETSFIYDALGRVTTTVHPKTLVEGAGASPVETYTHVGYDGLGRKAWETAGVLASRETLDAMDQTAFDAFIANNAKQYVYDTAGRLTRVILPVVDNPEDASPDLVHPLYDYIYDDYGNQIGIIDPKDRLTVFKYDHLGRQTTKYQPFVYAGDPTPATIYAAVAAQTGLEFEETSYDPHGRVSTQTDYKGQLTVFTYDMLGRLEYQRHYANAAAYNPAYPANNANPQTHYTYDNLGRKLTESMVSYDAAGAVVIAPQQWGYSYDDEGHVDSIITQNAGETGYDCLDYDYNPTTGSKVALDVFSSTDGINFTLKNQTDYGYDELGRLKTAVQDSISASYQYNPVGSIQKITYGNGITATYTYDAENRLDTLTWKNSSTATIASYDYDIYADGQRAKVTELSGKVTQWSYDNLNRLLTETVTSNYTHNYTYDLVGNRFKFNDGVSTIYYQRNEKDQILAESSNADYSNPSITYGYDYNGSLSSKAIISGSTTIYGYNLQNRLSTVTDGANPSIGYRYSPDGIRISKQTGTSPANYYIVDATNPTGYAQVIEDDDGQYIIGNDIFAQVTANGTAYLLYDGQGSVRYLANTSGALISGQTFDYDGYGNRTDDSVQQTSLLYTGEWYDEDLDWTYNRDRWSIPSLGIFNQPDRFSGHNTDPQSLHKYLYCYGDPINGIDPSGLFTQKFGYLAEDAIQQIYKNDHRKDNVSYGGWTKLGTPLGGAFRLKPDILNYSKSTWLEIKPLTVSGVAKAGLQYKLYEKAFGFYGYKPEIGWVPSTHFVIAGTQEIFFFNAGGIVFYTDLYDSAEDLLALTSYEAVKDFMLSPAGLRMSRSILGGLSRIPGLVTARANIDSSRFEGHFNIAYVLAGFGAL